MRGGEAYAEDRKHGCHTGANEGDDVEREDGAGERCHSFGKVGSGGAQVGKEGDGDIGSEDLDGGRDGAGEV